MFSFYQKLLFQFIFKTIAFRYNELYILLDYSLCLVNLKVVCLDNKTWL